MKEVQAQQQIVQQILSYLASKGIFHYRQKSGAVSSSQGGFHRFGTVGSPDIVCVIKGRYLGIEVKTPVGKQTEHEKEFQNKLEQAGGMYILAYSLDDVIKSLEQAQ
jgi:hypothetical protein